MRWERTFSPDEPTGGLSQKESDRPLNTIPVVDLHDAHSEDETVRQKLVETTARALRDIGFIFVRTPEIAPKLPEIYGTFRELFYLPPEILAKYVRPEIHYQRGFTPSRTEIGIYCQTLGPAESALPDDKRAWFIGPDVDRNHPAVLAYPAFYPENIWPDELPEFRQAATVLRNDLYEVGRGVLAVLEQYLGYKVGFFDQIIQDSPTLLRPLHYPTVTQESAEASVWACEHTDINFITVLPASTKEGLWVKTRNGEWIKGMAPGGCSLVQVGDMLQYMTGDHFHSAHHKVEAPEGVGTPERFSAALFVHARSDHTFEVDTNVAQHPERYPDITAGDLLLKRLKQIGLAKADARSPKV